MNAVASSGITAMLRSRSTVSAWVANTCWRRMPTRSIRRSTNASGRRSSKAAHAGRYRRRKYWARSRPSGVSCGPSRAADTAEGMSTLRRRASWVSRAMSTECSPTGGRAITRTAAPESAGLASSRSQASRSRTSARWKYAAEPCRRKGSARSSSAAHTTAPSRTADGIRTAIRSGSVPEEISPAAAAAMACAWARSEAQRQKRTLPPSRVSAGRRRCRRRARAAVAIAWDSACSRSRVTVEASGKARANSASAGRGPGHRDLARLFAQQRKQGALGEVGVLVVVGQHGGQAGGDAAAHVRALVQQRERAQDQVAGVQRAARGQQPVVVGVDLGELALAQRRGAGGVVAVLGRR